MSARIRGDVMLLLLVTASQCIRCYVHKIIYNDYSADKSNSGFFYSPNWPEKYPQDVRYFYIFVGTRDHQVQLTFDHFNIEGLSHSCDKDYLDIYIEIQSLTGRINISEDLFKEPLLGRFCGHNLEFIPRSIVSKSNMIVLDFFSDKNTQQSYNQDDHMGKLGFKGNYTFRLNELHLKFWSTSSTSPCHYLIHYNISQSGHVQSPNYPGLLPSPLNCTYEFRSNNPNHRISLFFEDFNLFDQNDMCPVEYVEIIDHTLVTAVPQPIIRRLCGSKPSYRFVSTHNRAYLKLVVLAGRDYMKGPHNINLYKHSLQNTGFKIRFSFSEETVSLRKLSNSFNRIQGTECDILVQSEGQSRGVLVSPDMSEHEVKRPRFCGYYFFGIHNSQNMETVLLDFSYFHIPKSKSNNCSVGSLSMYSAEFKLNDIIKRRRSVAMNQVADLAMCGDVKLPYAIKSRNPVFILKLNLTKMKSDRPIGFKLSYQFLKDYGISGHMVRLGQCHFKYESHLNGDWGWINSPFYNSFYPNNATCRYDLLANNDETIRIVFKMFQTAEEVSPNLISYHDVHLSCRQDYLSVSEIIRTDRGFLMTNNTERYCGTSIPGLLVSQTNSVGFRLVFQSSGEKNGPGFLAKYEFLKKQEVFTGKCGRNISTTALYGTIQSPNFPQRYPSGLICEWHIHSSRTSSRFLLLFTSFQIEGTAKSCSNAVVRIYEGDNVKPQSELCGTDSAIPAYESRSNFIRVRFLTDTGSRGAKGFQLIWTKVLPRLQNGSCHGFQCLRSNHCINNSLICNKVNNCGSFVQPDKSTLIDESDEIEACPVKGNHAYLFSGLGIVVIILFILTIIVLYMIHKNKYLIKKRLKLNVKCQDYVIHQSSTPSHSLIKDVPASSASDSLPSVPRRELYETGDGYILTNDAAMDRHRQFSFDLGDVLTRPKEKDNKDARSESGFIYREKMQKISIV